MQIEHKLSWQMEHLTEVPPQLMISQVSPDRIPGLVIWKDINARYAQLGCVRLQTGAIINQHQPFLTQFQLQPPLYQYYGWRWFDLMPGKV